MRDCTHSKDSIRVWGVCVNPRALEYACARPLPHDRLFSHIYARVYFLPLTTSPLSVGVIFTRKKNSSLSSPFFFSFFCLGPRCLATVCQLCRVAWHYYAILLKKRKGKQGLVEQKSWNNKAGEKRRRESEESGGRGRREGGRMSGEQRQEGTGYTVSLKSLRGSEDRERVSG